MPVPSTSIPANVRHLLRPVSRGALGRSGRLPSRDADPGPESTVAANRPPPAASNRTPTRTDVGQENMPLNRASARGVSTGRRQAFSDIIASCPEAATATPRTGPARRQPRRRPAQLILITWEWLKRASQLDLANGGAKMEGGGGLQKESACPSRCDQSAAHMRRAHSDPPRLPPHVRSPPLIHLPNP